MDKRSTQTVIPLNIEERQIKSIVKQHYNITFARQGKIKVVAKRIMALVLAQIHDNDMKLKPYYQMNVADVVGAADLKGKSPYSEAKKALDELASQVWSLEDIEKKIYKPKQLINTSTIEDKDGFEYGYNDGIITVVLNPALEPYFLNLAHHTSYELNHYMKFKSWYSMRVWELLSAFRDTGVYVVSINEYKELMDCAEKYVYKKSGKTNVSLMIKKTLSEPLEDLKGTALEFTVEPVLTRSGRGRPSVSKLRFELVRKNLTPEQQIEKWRDKKWWSGKHERRLNEAMKRWKISISHLAKHLPDLGIDGLGDLIKQFEQKQLSNNRMDDVAKYCNSAFLRAVEQVKETKQ